MRLLNKVGIVSAMTGVSRLFGLVREIVMANFFGTSTLQSAFVIAFRIPNLFRRLFGEGALGAAFIPVFVEIERVEGKARAQLFVARILGLMICVLGALVAIGIVLSFGVERWCGPLSRWTEAMPLLRIMLPYAVLICVAAILSAILNVHDRFAISSLTPVLLNIVWILVLLAVCPFLPEEGYWRIGAVSVGILISGFVQVLFQLPELKRVGYLFRLKFSGWGSSRYVRQVLLQMGPASLGIALAQINICMDGWLAFYGATWAPSALEYADRIIYLPLGLFATAFATVLLPTYSRQYAAGDLAEMRATMDRALSHLMLIMIPTAVGLMVLALPLVALIYQRGAFGADSTLWTARAVFAYAPGLLVFSVNKAVVPVFYAQKDLRTPVIIASCCIFGNFALNVLSVLFLPEGWRHVGIAASTVFNSLLNSIILIAVLHRRGCAPDVRRLVVGGAQALSAAALMGVAVYGAFSLLSAHLHLLLSVPLCIFVGVAVYLFAALLLAPAMTRDALANLPLFRRRKH
ncbi:MAG: murein biosynthesis integral membrane protein MurJ [Kiritimatiellia bacterium]